MRLTTLTTFFFLIALSVFVAAQQQKPLGVGVKQQSWFDRARDYMLTPSNTAATASATLVPITSANWQATLSSSVTQPWMILISGGNKTCYGRCGGVEEAWNKASGAAKTDSRAPKLGYVNCDSERLLCATWNAGPPSVWYIDVPAVAPGGGRVTTDIYVVPLNATGTSSGDITAIYKNEKYKSRPVLKSMFHPFDGLIAQSGLQVPVGYVLTAFGMIPSWAVMVVISLMARTFT